MAAVKKKKFLTYKGKPLIRCGQKLYYGNLNDKYILVLEVVETEKYKDIFLSKRLNFI